MDTARKHTDGIRAAHLARRRAEADELFHLAEFAACYDIDEDELLEFCTARRFRGGGPGTPLISEFCALEVAGLLQCSVTAAAIRISEALNLKWRHPSLWEAVQNLDLEPRRAAKAAGRCSDLPEDAADRVGRDWARKQHKLGWRAAFNLLDELVVAADPGRAATKESSAAKDRGVTVREAQHGNATVTATLDMLDAQVLDSAVNDMAHLLRNHGLGETESHDQLRARGLAILAVPALALRLQQDAIQHPLPADGTHDTLDQFYATLTDRSPAETAADGTPAPAIVGPGTGRAAAVAMADRAGVATKGGCLGHRCGTITTPVEKLLPKINLVVHIDAADAHAYNDGTLQGTAWVEHVGSVTLAALSTMLDGKRITARPVIDLNTLPAEDHYRPSNLLREAVALLHPYEAFPWSTRRSRTTDLDHTTAYQPSQGPGQTRVGNLAPLTRRVHRAKTLGAWRCRQLEPGLLDWVSPLGHHYLVGPEGTITLD